MSTLIVLPGVTPIYRPGFKPLLICPEDFTPTWCHHYLGGLEIANMQIWESFYPEATAYAITRARSEETVTVILGRSVWEALEAFYRSNDFEEEDILSLRGFCEIVEDLNGSN